MVQIVQRVVQIFAKELFYSKLLSLSILRFSFIDPKSCSLFGENFLSFVISATISSTSFINVFDFVASFTNRFSAYPWQCFSIALGWTFFYLSCYTRSFPKHIACTVKSESGRLKRVKESLIALTMVSLEMNEMNAIK